MCIIRKIRSYHKQPTSQCSYLCGRKWLENGINLLNDTKEIVKEITTKLPNTKIAFLGFITRKNIKNLNKNVTKTNKRPRNYCHQKDIGYADNSTDITKNYLGLKKLCINRKSNCFLANNLLKY